MVNYKSEQYLDNCLASVFNKFSGQINFEIILVNNDIDFNSAVVSLKYPTVKILNSNKNAGFGAANNKGAKKAEGEILFFLNPDAEIISNNISVIFNKFRENKKIAVIGPKLLAENKKTQWWCAGKEFTLFSLVKNKLMLVESKKVWESQEEIFTDWISGAAMFVRKTAFETIGRFDEKFFLYYEDQDLCKRLKKNGWEILFFPDFIVKHGCGKSMESKEKQKRNYYESQDYYFQKHFGNLQRKIVKFLRKVNV